MSQNSKAFRECRQKRIDTIFYKEERCHRALQKIAREEAKKTDPIEIRRNTAMGIPQGIDADKREIYELLYTKLDARAQELFNLIMRDLGLDEDKNAPLSPYTIFNVINYYEKKGLNQLKSSTTEDVLKYNPHRLPPYEKLFKNLIEKRAEFLIVAPKERLTLYAPYSKIKDEETQIELLKHMEELNLLPNYNFFEKYPELKTIYDSIKELDLNI